MVLDQMVASVTGVQTPRKILLNQVLICYRRSQISELCHIFKTSVTYFYVIIFPCKPIINNLGTRLYIFISGGLSMCI
jgi:hypothetical protein